MPCILGIDSPNPNPKSDILAGADAVVKV